MITNNSALSSQQSQPQLALQQPCGYRIDGQTIFINCAAIANNRDWGNVSGTLTIELWALRQPYFNGNFDGVCVAGTSIGEIFGQHFIGPYEFEAQYIEPPIGTWQLCLMLREWTEHGYTTRDAVNFDQPFHVQWKPNVIEGRANNVINVEFTQDDAQPANTAKQVKHETSIKTQESESSRAKLQDSAKGKPLSTPSTPPRADVVEKAKPASQKRSTQSATRVNINDASVEEIANLKGISKRVAQAIIEQRPYKNIDELLNVKGLGKKLLEKINQQVTV